MPYTRVPEEWLPTQEALDSLTQGKLTLPENHVGTNRDPRIAELYKTAHDNGHLVLGGTSTTLVYLLTGFYSNMPQYAIAQSIKDSLNRSGYEDESDLLTAYLYLYCYNPQTYAALYRDLTRFLKSKDEWEKVTHNDLEAYKKSLLWNKEKGLRLPELLTWEMRHLSNDEKTQLFSESRGSHNDMMRLLAIGGGIEAIQLHYSPFGGIPIEQLEELYGKRETA